MIAIAKKEFLQLFKSFRAIAVVAIILLVVYFGTKFIANTILEGALHLDTSASSIYTGLVFLMIAGFGFLFVLSLSHDTINKEVELQTMRFLVTKTSRPSIIIGKFLGIFAFWFGCILVSYVIIAIYAKQFFLFDFLVLMSFLTYIIGLALLLSLLVRKSSLSMFLSIILGIFIPIIGIASSFSDKLYFKVLRYLFPYYYQEGEAFLKFVPLLFGLAFLAIAVSLFQRRNV